MKTLKANSIIMLIFLFWGMSTQVIAQSDYCQVLVGWVDEKTRHSTSLFNVGNFCAIPNQDSDDVPYNRTFVHQDSGLTVKVGVDYYTQFPSKSDLRIRLGMNIVDNESDSKKNGSRLDVFLGLTSVTAETVRDKHWKVLQIRKQISEGGKTYTFVFECLKPSKKSRKIYKCNT